MSNALSGKGRLSAALADRIRSRAAEVGFRPSRVAQALKTGRSGIIGLVMPDLANPLFPALVQSLECAANRAGFGVLIADSHGAADAQADAIERLTQRGVDGLVIVPHRGTRPTIESLPVAIIHTPTYPRNTVSADHRQGGALAARTLLDLGHRDILIVGGDPQSDVQRDRIAGMLSEDQRSARYRITWSTDEAEPLADMVADGVTGVLTTSDLLALRVLGDAYQADIKVPKDLSIIGFDDLPLGTAVRPTLTTVAQDVKRVAQAAFAAVKAALDNEQPVAGGMVIPMTLTLRGSTAVAPTQNRIGEVQ